MRTRTVRKPTKREVAIALNAMRHFAPEGKVVEALPVRKERTYDPNAGSEHKEQVSVIKWWAVACIKYKLPIFALFAIPNGGGRSMWQAQQLKAEGVRSGIPDLCLAVPKDGYCGAYVEMKYGRGKESDAQAEVLAYLRSVGYFTVTCSQSDMAIDIIQDYLEGRLIRI